MVERESVQAEIARLTIRAGRTSVVRDMPAHIVPGRWLRMNEKIATLLPMQGDEALQVLAYVSETDVARIKPGASVRFFPDGDPFTVIAGRVLTVAISASTTARERGLTSLAGGPLPAVHTAAGERLHGAFYAVEVDVDVDPSRTGTPRTLIGSIQIASASYNPFIDRIVAALAALNTFLRF